MNTLERGSTEIPAKASVPTGSNLETRRGTRPGTRPGSRIETELEATHRSLPPEPSILLVKMSSLGDIVHTFPALTDAFEARPELRFNWLVEEAFVELAACHPAVVDVIPIGLRRWRKAPWRMRQEILDFRRSLAQQKYDLVLDAQGLIKSALVSRMADAPRRVGFSWRSAREPLASLGYSRGFDIDTGQHAVERTRRLFAQALSYAPADSEPRSGLVAEAGGWPRQSERTQVLQQPYLVFLHGCSWSSKEWPLEYWQRLARRVIDRGYQVYLPFGNGLEKARAHTIASGLKACGVLPEQTLAEMMQTLRQAHAVVTVDSGLGHLAAAWGVPVVGLYGSTDVALTGLLGAQARNLQSGYPCSPCFKRDCPIRIDPGPPCAVALTADEVFEHLTGVL